MGKSIPSLPWLSRGAGQRLGGYVEVCARARMGWGGVRRSINTRPLIFPARLFACDGPLRLFMAWLTGSIMSWFLASSPDWSSWMQTVQEPFHHCKWSKKNSDHRQNVQSFVLIIPVCVMHYMTHTDISDIILRLKKKNIATDKFTK